MSAALKRRVETLEQSVGTERSGQVLCWQHGEDVRAVRVCGQRFERMAGETVEELKERAILAVQGVHTDIHWMSVEEARACAPAC